MTKTMVIMGISGKIMKNKGTSEEMNWFGFLGKKLWAKIYFDYLEKKSRLKKMSLSPQLAKCCQVYLVLLLHSGCRGPHPLLVGPEAKERGVGMEGGRGGE